MPVVREAGTAAPGRPWPQPIAELAERARADRLGLAEICRGAPSRITNVGAQGTVVWPSPIINQPQVAILSTDGVRMRPGGLRRTGRRVGGHRPPGRQPVAQLRPPGRRRRLRRGLPGPGARRPSRPRAWTDEVRPCAELGPSRRAGVHRGLPGRRADRRTSAWPCLSRAIDDGEIRMQKQSRVFFQISGAGHEALGLAPGPPPASRLRLVLPLLPRPGAVPRARRDRRPRSCSRRWARPTTRARPVARCRRTGATPRLHIVTQSSPTGSQCIPAVGCAEAGRYIVRRPDLPGCSAHGDELTYVSLGEGACSEGEFWESLEHRLHAAPARPLRGGRQRLRHLGAGDRPAPGAGGRAGPGVPGPRGRTGRRHRLPGRAPGGPDDRRARPGRRGPGAAPRRRRAARTRTRRPTPRASTARADELERGGALTIRSTASRPSSSTPASLSADEAAAIRAEATETVAKATAEALAGARPDPAPDHRPGRGPAGRPDRARAPTSRATPCRWARPSA